MTFIKQAGLLRSARSWGVLGLVLALAGMTGSAQGRPPEQPRRALPITCDRYIKQGINPNPLVTGQPATVTIQVGNSGVGPCWGTSPPINIMQDPKPIGLTFTAAPTANLPGWLCYLVSISGDARCDSSIQLPAGYSVIFTVPANVTAPSGGTITNCATASTYSDINPANNQICVTYSVTP